MMSNRKLFNRLVKDPTTFEIMGTDEPKSARANSVLQDLLSDYIDRLESFAGDYAHHAHYDIDLTDEPDKDDLIQHSGLTKYDRELLTFRMEFMDFIHEGARLLNCDTSDIYDTFGIDEITINKSFGRIREHKDINDQDALRILSGVHNEATVLLTELSSGQRYLQTALSKYLSDNEDGMMYDDPDAIIPDEPKNP